MDTQNQNQKRRIKRQMARPRMLPKRGESPIMVTPERKSTLTIDTAMENRYPDSGLYFHSGWKIPVIDPDMQVDFPVDALPLPMRSIAINIAEVFQIDPSLSGMTALATLSGAMGKGFYVEGAVPGRKTHCNLYVVAGAPKSYGKGAAGKIIQPLIDASHALDEDFQKNTKARLNLLLDELKSREKELSLEIKAVAEQTAKRAPKYKLYNQLTDVRSKIEQINADLKSAPTHLAGTVTAAALEEILARNNGQVMCYSADAGDAMRFAMGTGGKGQFELYLSGYSVETFNSTRISRGDKKLIPCLSILWLVQPGVLRPMYAMNSVSERGLSARFLSFLVKDEPPREDDGLDRRIDEFAYERWCELINRILSFKNDQNPIRVSREAVEIYRQWHNEAVRFSKAHYQDNPGELGRAREQAIRIGGVMAVAEGKQGIDARIAAHSVHVSHWCLHQMLYMLEQSRHTRHKSLRSTLVATLRAGPVSERDLDKNHGIGRGKLEHLLKQNPDLFDRYKGPSTPKGGRPPMLIKLKENNGQEGGHDE